MTFRQFLEDVGQVGASTPWSWASDNTNGEEFNRKGIRAKRTSSVVEPDRGRKTKTPEEVFGFNKNRRPSQ